jgi:hypothetical protein
MMSFFGLTYSKASFKNFATRSFVDVHNMDLKPPPQCHEITLPKNLASSALNCGEQAHSAPISGARLNTEVVRDDEQQVEDDEGGDDEDDEDDDEDDASSEISEGENLRVSSMGHQQNPIVLKMP